MIKQRGSRFRLYTADGSRPLGTWTTHEKAAAQEAAIKASQHGRHAEREKPMPRKYGDWSRRKVKNARRAAGKAMSNAEVVATIQREAKAAGATLKNNGKGGLDPNLVLKVFRRDKYTCQVPNCKTPKKDSDIDHIGGHAAELEQDPEASAWLKEQAEKGKENTLDGLHVLCGRHHDLVHQRDRAIEDGKRPPPMTK